MKRKDTIRVLQKKTRVARAQVDRAWRRLSKLQKKSGRLLIKLQGRCQHARVYEFRGELLSDFGDVITPQPMRVCFGCNLIEQESWEKLTARPRVTASFAKMSTYRVLGTPLG